MIVPVSFRLFAFPSVLHMCPLYILVYCTLSINFIIFIITFCLQGPRHWTSDLYKADYICVVMKCIQCIMCSFFTFLLCFFASRNTPLSFPLPNFLSLSRNVRHSPCHFRIVHISLLYPIRLTFLWRIGVRSTKI